MGIIVGIDLGTSTTEAAVYRNGKPVMIKNFENEIITPSVVGLDEEGKFVIGERARAQYLLAPERTAIEVKRKIGSDETVSLGSSVYTPVELSARLLEYVKEYVSDYLGEEVKRAVVSVPAYFDDIQRKATVTAGRMAGLEVERILNEPTAAALSYGLNHMDEESYVLVYDLGGGTFDVTLLEMFDGVLEVKASSGDNQLGGKDFDECLITWMVEEFEKENHVNLRKNSFAMARLKEEAEKCKKQLSREPSCHISIPFLVEKKGRPLAFDKTITVEQFEQLIAPLVERTHQPIDVVLGDSGITVSEIDKVILVGGSTRVPMIARDIQEYLGIEPSLSVNPDFAVAEGAAIQAAITEGLIGSEDSLVVTDVNPYTLGVRVTDGYTNDRMSVVIPRNVTIPVTRSEMYFTNYDGQTKADIEVYQGESSIATHNHLLGQFTISGIPPREAGEERIRVEFSYNLNGMLEVQAQIVSTGEQASIAINMMQQADSSRIDVSAWKDAARAKDFRAVIRRAERLLRDMEAGNDPLAEDLDETIYQLKKALITGELERARIEEEALIELLEE